MKNRQPHLLVVDDESAARRGAIRALGGAYRFTECDSGVQCLAVLEGDADVDLVLLDLRMPGLDGHATLERIRTLQAPPPVVVVTADASLRNAIDAVKSGAADFLAKPYEIDALRLVVRNTLERNQLRRENRVLRAEVDRLGAPRLLGTSPAMRETLTALDRVAPTDVSVLLRGESGTGKELAARHLHAGSAVAGGPFVALNCAAVPENLLESELFGHQKGAFTGADQARVGRFQEAHGGTLFLDEIGDMPAMAQAKLLRVLQDGVVEPLGGGKPVRADVRVVAATHRDLEALVAEETFREDLYYRLRVVEVTLPPLRDRGDDVLRLAQTFLDGAGRGRFRLAPGAEDRLRVHTWPGNVRELKNAMERAAIFAADGIVQVGDLPAELRRASTETPTDAEPASQITPDDGTLLPFVEAKQQLLDRFERTYFDRLLTAHHGNVSHAARAAGIHRQNVQKKLKALGVDPAGYRSA